MGRNAYDNTMGMNEASPARPVGRTPTSFGASSASPPNRTVDAQKAVKGALLRQIDIEEQAYRGGVDSVATRLRKTIKGKEKCLLSTTSSQLDAAPLEPRAPGAHRVNRSISGEHRPSIQALTRQIPCDDRSSRNMVETNTNTDETDTDELMLQATQVAENDEEMARAEEVRHAAVPDEESETKNRVWNHKMIAVVVAICMAAVIILVVSVVLASNKENTTTVETNPASRNDTVVGADDATLGPSITPEQSLVALLPPHTIASIQDHLNSPQQQAYSWLVGDPSLGNYTERRLLQRFALATVFFSLGGRKWYRSENWLSYEHHECEWETKDPYETYRSGVEYWGRSGVVALSYWPCEGKNGSAPASLLPHQLQPEGTYTQLFIENNNLQGTIPEELYLMPKLQTLNLLKNSIHGTISPRVAELQDLELVFLDGNDLTGTLPTEIGLLPNLSSLWTLGNLKLGGTIPSEIGQLSMLKEVLIDSCNFSGSIPSTIGQMASLEWFWAWSNPLTGSLPTELGQVDSLRQLGLWNCDLSGTIPSQLGMVSSMKELALDSNPMSGTIPSELGMLSKLTTLHIGDLSLSQTIPTQMGLLSNVTSLFLNGNALSGSLPSQLAHLTQLWRFWSFNNVLTGTIDPAFGAWESLEIIILSNNSLTGTIPPEMAKLTSLKHVALDTNKLTGSMDPLLNANMTVLSLHSNSLTGVVPSELGFMTDLTVLSIQNNNLVGTIPLSLCDADSWTEGVHVDCKSVECTCEVCICDDGSS